jgi:integrase
VTLAKKELTDVFLRKWKPQPGDRKIKWDARIPGFGIRPSGNGKKVFVLVKRFPGTKSPSPRAIGEYGAITLETARETAREWLALIKAGKDPTLELERRREEDARAEREAQEAKAKADTESFAHAFDLFVKQHLNNPKKPLRTATAIEQAMKNCLLPAWGKRSLASITKHDVKHVINGIYYSGKLIAANRLLAYTKKFFKWCSNYTIEVNGVVISLLETSPAASVEMPAEETERDRVLNDLEIKALWAACAHLDLYGHAVKLMLATAARRGEVSAMTWAEIVGNTWILPSARVKNKRKHSLPLSMRALAILEDVPPRSDNAFVLGKPLRAWSKNKKRLDRLMLAELRKLQGPHAVLEPWRLHDLRRTAATNMERLKVALPVTEAVLNHVSGSKSGVAGIYQQHEYTDEKRDAVELWGEELNRIVNSPPPAMRRVS